MYVCEGEATRLAELALIFIPTVFIALSAKYRSKLQLIPVARWSTRNFNSAREDK